MFLLLLQNAESGIYREIWELVDKNKSKESYPARFKLVSETILMCVNMFYFVYIIEFCS